MSTAVIQIQHLTPMLRIDAVRCVLAGVVVRGQGEGGAS